MKPALRETIQTATAAGTAATRTIQAVSRRYRGPRKTIPKRATREVMAIASTNAIAFQRDRSTMRMAETSAGTIPRKSVAGGANLAVMLPGFAARSLT